MSTTPTLSAYDVVEGIAVGQRFSVDGRHYTRRSYSVSGYTAGSQGGERLVVEVWGGVGERRATTAIVRPSSRVVVKEA
jgi:hypothetical protein